MKKLLFILIPVLLLVGCNFPSGAPESVDPAIESPCGDGICGGAETAENCPLDCGSYGGMHPQAEFSGSCGDGVCEGPENYARCPADCQSTSLDRSAVVSEVSQEMFYLGLEDECWDKSIGESDQRAFNLNVGPDVGSADAPLFYTIVVHVEPSESYREATGFLKDAERLRRIAGIVSAHGGVMTIQVQPPFIDMAEDLGDPILEELAADGHEIALHFHENMYVGNENSDELPLRIYTDALTDLRTRIIEVTGVSPLNFSGANTYIHIWEAAAAAGFENNTNYKNRYTQSSAPGFAVVNPWRPAGAANEDERLAHDPAGPVIYIPSGVYPTHCTRVEAVPRPYVHEAFDYVTRALAASMQSVTPGRVNTFYSTIHPGDFRAQSDDEQEFAVWDEWLTEVIDPLAADGRLVWATISEMADAFEVWERAGE